MAAEGARQRSSSLSLLKEVLEVTEEVMAEATVVPEAEATEVPEVDGSKVDLEDQVDGLKEVEVEGAGNKEAAEAAPEDGKRCPKSKPPTKQRT